MKMKHESICSIDDNNGNLIIDVPKGFSKENINELTDADIISLLDYDIGLEDLGFVGEGYNEIDDYGCITGIYDYQYNYLYPIGINDLLRRFRNRECIELECREPTNKEFKSINGWRIKEE